ncbi:ABC transporter permease [Haloarchaeobius sp. HRN-SO-5]|uniref:ABC transporter permease n=1 Tax=Haloarchaeobius sp. HRN-SO-5 TaxID=3446118 RepID=UPI003EBE872D
MSRAGFLARRFVVAVASAYAVMTVAFAVVATMPDPNLGWLSRSKTTDQVGAINAVREAKNLNDPLHERYLSWLVDVTTLDWGRSVGQFGGGGPPVTDLLAETIPVTLAYVVPAVVASFAVALVVGSYAALNPHSRLASAVSSVGYVGLGIPNFFLAEVVLLAAVEEFGWIPLGFSRGVSLTDPGTLVPYLVPAAVLTTTLAAGQLRYVRAEAAQYFGEEFVTLVRAKGASDVRVLRHVLRNAALPLLSLFVADLVSTLVVQVYVIEFVFNIPGLGALGLQAISDRDMPLILGTTMVVAYVGIAGNFFQDVVYTWLDPRTEAE